MHTEAYKPYARLQQELKRLISNNLGESIAAEKVRNLMDELWPQLSETEKEEINKDVKLPPELFWPEIEERLREMGITDPQKMLQSIPCASRTLKEIVEEKRSKDGDEAALKLLERTIRAMMRWF